jgi:hypothetical protein
MGGDGSSVALSGYFLHGLNLIMDYYGNWLRDGLIRGFVDIYLGLSLIQSSPH